jgi:hypothetical protein
MGEYDPRSTRRVRSVRNVGAEPGSNCTRTRPPLASWEGLWTGPGGSSVISPHSQRRCGASLRHLRSHAVEDRRAEDEPLLRRLRLAAVEHELRALLHALLDVPEDLLPVSLGDQRPNLHPVLRATQRHDPDQLAIRRVPDLLRLARDRGDPLAAHAVLREFGDHLAARCPCPEWLIPSFQRALSFSWEIRTRCGRRGAEPPRPSSGRASRSCLPP